MLDVAHHHDAADDLAHPSESSPSDLAADGSLFWLAAQLKRNDSQWRSHSSDSLALIRLEKSGVVR